MHRDASRRPGATWVEARRAQEAAPPLRNKATLVHDPDLESTRRAVTHTGSVCDCACFAIEGGAVPILPRPLLFYLELTPDCHNRCPACASAAVAESRSMPTRRRPPLSAAEWRQVVESLRPHAHRLKLTGGEPTLHPEFADIVRHLATTGIPFTLFTNGRWRDTDRLLDLLVAAPNLDGLLVSLHGSSAAAHEAFTRTPGSFEDTMGALRAAVARGIAVTLSCVITAHNWARVDEVMALAGELGTQGVVFNRYLGRPIAGLSPTTSQLRAAIARVEARRAGGAASRLGNCVPACFVPTAQSGCLAGVAFLTVDPWGRARPCNHVPEIVGNVLEEPIEQIWHSREMEVWRGLGREACAGCALIDTCRAGCRALAALDPSGHDPLLRAPLAATARADPADVFLYTESRPVARFSRRSESCGPVLVHGNQIFVATDDDNSVIELLDGQKTVCEIEAQYGQHGIDLVASLYQHGMIDLL